jgi:hypothetical protein
MVALSDLKDLGKKMLESEGTSNGESGGVRSY